MKPRVSIGGVVQCTDQTRSWFALITFCAVNALVAALGFAVLIGSFSIAYAVAQSLH